MAHPTTFAFSTVEGKQFGTSIVDVLAVSSPALFWAYLMSLPNTQPVASPAFATCFGDAGRKTRPAIKFIGRLGLTAYGTNFPIVHAGIYARGDFRESSHPFVCLFGGHGSRFADS